MNGMSLAAARRWVITFNEAIRYHHAEFSLYRTIEGQVKQIKISDALLGHLGIILYYYDENRVCHEILPTQLDLKLIGQKAAQYQRAAQAKRR